MSNLLIPVIFAGLLCGPAWAVDEMPRSVESEAVNGAAGATEAEVATEPATVEGAAAPVDEASPSPEADAATESTTPLLPDADAPALPSAETPPLPEPVASPLPADEAQQLPEPLATPLTESDPPPLPEPEASPLPDAERPALDATAAPEGTPPAGAEPVAPPAAPADAQAPASPAADGEIVLPVPDEDGVLPGLPEDRPGVGLDTGPGAPAGPGQGTAEPVAVEAPPPDAQETLFLLGTEVPPGAIDWLSWAASESFEGISTPTPVLVVNGTSPGPTLCLTAAVHGDELNGVEMVRRIMYSLDPKKLDGAVIGVPIVNLHGFRRSSRYLPDRRDLNRYFPGSPTGSSAARIAHSFFHEIILHCDQLVDLHTGSFHRANLPQLRADLNNPEVVAMTEGFGATVVLHSTGDRGTLRRAATDAGIPAVTLEAGEPMRLQPKEVAHGVKGIETLLDKLGMVNKVSLWGDPQPVYYDARWIRANSGGILFSNVNLGERIRKDEVLGTVTDPITNKRTEIRSPYDGRIIGRALNQVVMPGFAAFHIGIRTSEEQLRAESTAKTAEAAPLAPASDAAPTDPDEAPPAEADATQGEGEALGYEEEEERPE
ncbi:MAG: succinylglutamate desuccinylase [Gammaproteobacteria bacterium]